MLELGQQIREDGIELFFGRGVNLASQSSLAVEELDQQVLRTMYRH
jgi:hypothetical protein